MTKRAPLDPPSLSGYEFLDRLGSGGFSDVFLYEREFPRQKVAIKVLAEEALTDEGRERFTAEANVMASLSTHPYIVAIHQADISPEGHPYIVMQYYPRPNFSVRARTARFTVADVLRSGVQIASAVETAHRSEVLHRDIKPANILTSDYGQPGLTDFGIAVAADQRSVEAEGMSIPWSPPEVVAGSGLADEQADIFSLGATLYTLLAGHSPFEVPGASNRSIDVIDRIRRAQPAPLGRGDVPDSLWRLLLQSMHKDPDARPASAAAFGRALQVIEVEQRLDMTPFEVSEGDEPAPVSEPIDADAGSTRVKGVSVIESQPDRPTRTRATSHEAFRPADATMRTTKRDGKTPGVGPTSPALISNTPFLPSAAPPPPAVPAAGGAGPAPTAQPTAGSYVAPQPVAAPTKERAVTPTQLALGVAGVAVILVVLAGLLLVTGAIGGGGAATTTTAPSALGKVEIVSINKVDPADPESKDFLVTWRNPEGLTMDDKVTMQINSKLTETVTGKSELPFRSSSDPPCLEFRVYRGGELASVQSSVACS